MTRDTRVAAALILTLALASPAWAQEPQEPPIPREPAPAAPDRPALELSLQDAVAQALENNVDIAVERFNPESSALSVKELEGFYDPVVFSALSKASRTDPARSAFAGADKVDTDTFTYDFGASQALGTGGSLRVDFSNNRQDTNSVFTTFNPSFASSLTASLQQPLLRNRKTDGSRAQIRVARRTREISDAQFRQTVVNTAASVKQLYYDLLFAMDNLEVQKKSLSLAQKLLGENEIKVRVGTMAPLDVVAAESEVASREEGLINAESALLEAEDALKRSIFAKNDAETWALRIVPTDRPTAEPMTVDVAGAIAAALEKRTDIVAARKGIESAETQAELARNQVLPALDLVASYGTTGIGGTFIERMGFGGPIVGQTPGGYGDALSDVFGRDFPTWSVGVNVSYAIRNRQARASSARARVARDQAVASLRRLEMQVTAEVRSAGRAVETNFKRVASTRAARVLQERRLDAEEKRFAAGMSTNFLVTQAQRDLAVAAVAELRAVADYRRSVVNFERVQEAGGGVSFAGGGGSPLGVAGLGSSARSASTGGAGSSASFNP